MARRIILLVLALLVAAGGTALVYLYAHDANQRAAQGQQLVTVLVAKNPISAGTTAGAAQSAGDMQSTQVARNSLAQGAVSSVDTFKSEVALATIYPGQQILSQMFGAQASTSELPITPGHLGFSVQLGDPERVAGFLQNGSNVTVFLTIRNPNAPLSDASADVTRVLIPSISVIGVGNTTLVSQTETTNGQTNTEQIPRTILTLAGNQTQAQKVIYGGEHGQLWFALLPTGATPPSMGIVTSANNLFS